MGRCSASIVDEQSSYERVHSNVKNRSDIAIVGRACRLPGASSVEGLWELLSQGRCAVSRIPSDRWSLERLGHPRAQERGKSYTWSAGVLDDIWAFDPGVFGISPREAEQMDPQQRLLLELTWEALEDAGIRPSAVAGTNVGVFVGASSLDYGNLRVLDAASGDAYAATGNTLSIISNRISYIFDLKGPSFTIDTACSSSLVALDAAVNAIRAGRVDTAVVAGVNLLVSPFSFISFSNASMLSRTGLCQAFSAKADGYVRAEGGVVLVLRTAEAAARAGNTPRTMIAATGVNSDGRTTGISLPSGYAQADLLEQVYREAGISPDDLAFVEAHGTGTPVGDPIETGAIGKVLGATRATPLVIGSIKTNIGHTEPVSGLAGLLKASLALEHDVLPPSLHCEDGFNPNIDFAGLQLDVATTARALTRTDAPRYAGVNSFGFGGTNAHVVLTDAPSAAAPARAPARPEVLLLSAQSRAALAELAQDYADRLEGADDAALAQVAAAAAHRRERLGVRAAISLDGAQAVVPALRSLAEGGEAEDLAVGTAVDRVADVAFVYSGNGGQYAGMGRDAYAASAVFRDHFDRLSALFETLSGWSLTQALHDPALEDRLALTSVAQPLIYAIQSASTAALRTRGLVPQSVLGHSVGEIAAAEAAGVLSVEQAVQVIYHRSHHQEAARGLGSMAVLLAPVEDVQEFLKDFPDLDLAAYNSPKGITVAGPVKALDEALKAFGRKRRRGRKLDLDYPFHGRLMASAEGPLLRDLAGLAPSAGHTPVVSTVTGGVLGGEAFNARYWWKNIRQPVRFSEAVQEAARRGARIFLEIGPRAVLLSHVGDSIEPLGLDCATIPVLNRKGSETDPFARALATALVQGASVDEARTFGPEPVGEVALPSYPWQRAVFRLAETTEVVGVGSARSYHPLIGARTSADSLEWRGHVDVATVPWLDDHRVDGQVILPGAAYVEMALAAARELYGTPSVTLTDLEIQQPMIFAEEALREIAVRLSPASSLLQILSRPRLSQAAWQIHVVAKLVEGDVPEPAVPAFELDAERAMDGAELYRRAEEAGLAFGPSFRAVATATRADEGTIVSDLLPGEADAHYGLTPARLDACFHGLITIFSDLRGADASRAYVPIRFGEIRLVRPGAVIARAVIRVRRCNERSIVADFVLLDTEGAVIASLREGRFQSLRTKSADDLEAYAIAQRTELATEPTALPLDPQPTIATIVRRHALAVTATGDAAISAGHMLLEGWATSLAYRLAAGLCGEGPRSLDAMLAQAPGAPRAWLANALLALEGSGLASVSNGAWSIVPGVKLPATDEVMRWIAADHPELSAELLLAADLGGIVERLLAGATEAPRLSSSTLDAFVMRGATVRASAAAVMRLLVESAAKFPRDRALRLAQAGFGPLSAQAAIFAAQHEARLTVVETDRRLAERARLALPDHVTVVEDATTLQANAFDMVLASDVLHRIDRDLLDKLAESLASGGLLAAIEPAGSLFRDLVFGLAPTWFDRSAGEDLPVGRLDDVAGWQRTLSASGLVSVTAERAVTANGDDLVLLAEAPPRPKPAPGQSFAFIIGCDDAAAAETASSLATLMVASGVHVSIILDSEQSLRELLRETPDTVVYLAGAFGRGGDPAERLRDRCLGLKRCVDHLGTRQTRLWVVCPGATRDRGGPSAIVETGVWAFTRTLANETANLDVRRIDLSPTMVAKRAAERLRDVILSGTSETEIVLDDDRTGVVRFTQGVSARKPQAGAVACAAQLERGTTGGLNEMRWVPADRRRPKAGEIEIAVEATGLNFRDVLWALSMLPEEILEDGFAGPRLGLECAGRVATVGAGVTAFKPGDRVVAFAQSGFSTHIVVPELVVAPAPPDVSSEAAATVPVAFLTAYYALINCARLRKGEWLLVHGGAGGVGLAALQIAHMRGARVIATAGSPEKRALVRALGAEHVLDSRSLSFVDEVRRITGDGVDVVLNSLFGEAMERSLNSLRPFGRFIELGKRDYVANTHIGLRPFRRNLSYFGVDLDQVLQHQGVSGAKLFREVMALFGKGRLKPLPYQPFAADEVSDAFRLMQQSGHIGKIVIAPPEPGTVPATMGKPFVVSSERTHLVTGGLGGFGLEAARWLADRGAKHIVLVGRSGAASEEAKACLAELGGRGVKARAEACDIAERKSVEDLLRRVEKSGPALAGIIHGAMVLRDGLIANLDHGDLETVLKPKVTGAMHLDALTRGKALDYFVLFSSATTFIGNPGQGSYVAGNGAMEGLARQRRRAGLPALAVAWGAIGDVGVLARNKGVMDTLAGRVGVTPMAARRSLDLMADALAFQGPASDDAVIAIAAMHWGKARERLATLRSPSYASLGSEQQAESGGAAAISIPALLRSHDIDEARKIVADAIVEDIARILRLPKDDISRTRQLSEIGLDSLMGVELGASLQERFALEAPPAGISSGLTVAELSDTLIQSVGAPVTEGDAAVVTLAQKHLSGVDAEALGSFNERVELKSRELKEILP